MAGGGGGVSDRRMDIHIPLTRHLCGDVFIILPC